VIFERECCFCAKLAHAQSSQLMLTDKIRSFYYLSLYHCYLCCIGEDRSTKGAGISFIFPGFAVYYNFVSKVLFSNLVIGKQFQLRKEFRGGSAGI
jgi:hypothetical protein